MSNRFKDKIEESVKNAEEAIEESAEREEENIAHKMHKAFRDRRKTAFQKMPAVFVLLGTFGVVGVFYGAKHLMESVPYLKHHPEIVLVIGIFILFLTGRIQREGHEH